METKYIKVIAIAIIVLPLLLIMGMNNLTATVSANDDDAAALYKKKTCFACHKADASKAFDPAKEDQVLVDAILKGVKAEKPPHMPAYEAKGIDAEKAAALVAHMRSLREAAN